MVVASRGGIYGRLPKADPLQGVCVCCFVLLVPTWLLYRVPRVSPGITAPNLRLLPSLAMPVPPSSLQTTPDVPVLLALGEGGLHVFRFVPVCMS